MRKLSILVCFILLAAPLAITQANAAPPSAGGACSKIGSFGDTPKARYICTQSGKKNIWKLWTPPSPNNNSTNNGNKGSGDAGGSQSTQGNPQVFKTAQGGKSIIEAPIPIALPIPQSTEPNALTFANVINHVSDIPQSAWKKIQTVLPSNPSVKIPSQIWVGPTTKLDITDGVSKVQEVLDRSAKFWSGFSQSKYISVYFYNYADEPLAEKQLLDVTKNRKYNPDLGGLLGAMKAGCSKTDCTWGGSAQVPGTDDAQMVAGQSGSNRDPRTAAGGLIMGDYIHLIEGAQWIGNKNCTAGKNCDENSLMHAFSPCWITSGPEFYFSLALTDTTYESYLPDRAGLAFDMGPTHATDYSQASLRDYLFNESPATCYDHRENGSSFFLGASVGALVTEILTALDGPQSIMAVEALGARGQDFPTAFKNVYGISWSDASTILSKVLAAEYESFGPPPK